MLLTGRVFVIMLAIQTVHTSGVNWTSIAVIVGSIVASLTLVMTIIGRWNKTVKDDITRSVDNLSEVLTAKMETKETVNQLRLEVAELRGQVLEHHSQRARND
jgi:hypothetical protein